MRLSFVVIVALMVLMGGVFAQGAQIVGLDNFEDTQLWTFSAGGEFPGADGSIDCSGNRLALHYDFTKGGAYVAAIYSSAEIPGIKRFIVTLQSDYDCLVKYRITDMNGRVYQAYATRISAGVQTELSCPVNAVWEGAWSGNKGETAQPEGVAQLWICVSRTESNPAKGTVYLSNLRAEADTNQNIMTSGPDRVPTPYSDFRSPKMTECYFPSDQKVGDLRVFMGYNEPGESANDARDLRITTKDGKYLTGLWGRVWVKGEQEYLTPTDFPIRTGNSGGSVYWEWDNTDARIGFQQLVRVRIDSKGVTSTVYVRFLREHRGSIVIPCVVPDGRARYYAGDGGSKPYVMLVTSKNATRAEYSVDGGGFYILNNIARPQGVSFSYGQRMWMHFFRSEVSLMYITITPADGVAFPKGYSNAVQLRFTQDPAERLPGSIDKPAWNDGAGIYIMETDASGKRIIPRVNRPHIFLPDERKQIAVAVYNFSATAKRSIALEYVVKDYSNRTVIKATKNQSIGAGSIARIDLDLPIRSNGIYSLTMSAKSGNTTLARKTTRFSVVPKPAQVDVGQSFFGIDPLFLEGSKENMNMLRRLGIRWLRLGGGVWYPAEGDRAYLQTLKDNGIGYFLLIESPDMVRGPEYNSLIDYYEISNEPDGWTSPDQYLKTARPIYEKAKRVNPAVNVLACSVSGGDSDSGFSFTRQFLTAGGAAVCDIIPYHPYSAIRAFGPGLQPVSPEENRLYDKLMEGRELCKQHNLRTWIGEVGFLTINAYRFPTPDFHKYEKGYANYMARLFLISKCVPGLERVIWFHLCMDDTPLNLNAAYYGTYDSLGPNNNITPCLTAYANLASLIDDARFVKKLAFEYPDIWGVQTNKNGRSVVAVWSPKDNCKVVFDYSRGIELVDIVGRQRTIEPKNGKITLSVTDEPEYIIVPDSQPDLVESIEKSKVVFDEPIGIEGFSLAPGGMLSVSLKNKYNRPIKARMILATAEGKEAWDISMQSNQSTAMLLKCKNAKLLESVQGFKLQLTAEGKTSVRSGRVSSSAVTPDLIAVRTGDRVLVDGNLEEWKSARPIVSDKHEQVAPPDPGAWKGPQDLSFTAWLMHDDDNLYFACQVRDDVHSNNEIPSKIWAGDSIQMGLANLDSPYNYTEINLGYSSTFGSVGFETMGVDAGKPLEGLQLAAKMIDGGMIYEAAIPFRSLKGLAIGSGAMVRCAFIVNDIDNAGRKWMAIKDPGLIGANKDAKYFPVMYLEP